VTIFAVFWIATAAGYRRLDMQIPHEHIADTWEFAPGGYATRSGKFPVGSITKAAATSGHYCDDAVVCRSSDKAPGLMCDMSKPLSGSREFGNACGRRCQWPIRGLTDAHCTADLRLVHKRSLKCRVDVSLRPAAYSDTDENHGKRHM
jgi:hypothetical protein